MNDSSPLEDQAPQKSIEKQKQSFWKKGPWRKLFFFVALPTLLSMFYFGLLASNIYVSVSKFSVKVTGEKTPSAFGDILSTAVSGPQTGNAELVQEYIRSRSLLNYLQDTLNLRKSYSDESVDIVARLPKESSMEDFLQYYQKMISVTKDELSGVMTLKVRAFDPETAQNIGERILDRTEQFVNMLSNRMREDAISLAKKELQEAESNVIASTQSLQQYRHQHQNLDPVQAGGGILEMIQELQSQLSSARIELEQASEYLKEDNPKITKLKNKISAIESQIEKHRQALTGGSGGSIVNILQEYERLKLEKELAQEQYKIALSSLESARKEASKKSTYLLRMVEPSLPDEATEPNRILKVATVLAICLVAYAVLGLLIAAIKEHQL